MNTFAMAEMVMSLFILRKYGYPPDVQDAAVQTVLQQAEALSSTWRMPMRANG